MLLSNASVVSLDDGTLTLRFARDGDVKGFTTSGCDADLQRVLASAFGLNVRIRALSGNDPGAGGERPRLNAVPDRPADPGPARTPPAGGSDSAAAHDSGLARGASHPPAGEGAGRPAPAGRSGHPEGGGSGHPGGGGPPGPGDPASAGGGTDSGGGQNQEGPRSAGRGSSARGGGREAARARAGGIPAGGGAGPAAPRANASSAAPVAPSSAGAIDIPDAEDMASPGQAEITGMDLIQRELGGQIIGEIEE